MHSQRFEKQTLLQRALLICASGRLKECVARWHYTAPYKHKDWSLGRRAKGRLGGARATERHHASAAEIAVADAVEGGHMPRKMRKRSSSSRRPMPSRRHPEAAATASVSEWLRAAALHVRSTASPALVMACEWCGANESVSRSAEADGCGRSCDARANRGARHAREYVAYQGRCCRRRSAQRDREGDRRSSRGVGVDGDRAELISHLQEGSMALAVSTQTISVARRVCGWGAKLCGSIRWVG